MSRIEVVKDGLPFVFFKIQVRVWAFFYHNKTGQF